MDSARNKHTGEIVTGFDLKRLDYVDKNAYVCIGCPVPVNPVSFELHHKKVPHFKLFIGTDHLADCFESKRESLYGVAARSKVAKPDGLPFSIPSKLILTNDEVIKVNELSGDGESSEQKTQRKQTSGLTAPGKHNYTVRTIRPLVRFYLQFPWDRDAKLSVQGLEGRRYNEIFVKLPNENITYFQPKIFFGNLRFTEKLFINNDYIEVKLSQGVYENEAAINNYRVRINISKWTERQRQSLIDEIESAQEEVGKIWFKIKNRKIKRTAKTDSWKAWFFFLGEQDAQDQFLFHVHNFRLIACTTGKYIHGNAVPTIKTGKNINIANTHQFQNSSEYSPLRSEPSSHQPAENYNNQLSVRETEDKPDTAYSTTDSWLIRLEKQKQNTRKPSQPSAVQQAGNHAPQHNSKQRDSLGNANKPALKKKEEVNKKSFYANFTNTVKRFLGF